jgi:hypothetical protein
VPTVSPDPKFETGEDDSMKYLRYIGMYLFIANSRMLQKLRNAITIIKADGFIDC